MASAARGTTTRARRDSSGILPRTRKISRSVGKPTSSRHRRLVCARTRTTERNGGKGPRLGFKGKCATADRLEQFADARISIVVKPRYIYFILFFTPPHHSHKLYYITATHTHCRRSSILPSSLLSDFEHTVSVFTT